MACSTITIEAHLSTPATKILVEARGELEPCGVCLGLRLSTHSLDRCSLYTPAACLI